MQFCRPNTYQHSYLTGFGQLYGSKGPIWKKNNVTSCVLSWWKNGIEKSFLHIFYLKDKDRRVINLSSTLLHNIHSFWILTWIWDNKTEVLYGKWKSTSEVIGGRLMYGFLIVAIRKYHKLKTWFYYLRVLKVRNYDRAVFPLEALIKTV